MKSITVQELEKALDTGLSKKAVLLDVRTPAEYRAEHIAAAENIPVDEIDAHTDDLKRYDTIYVQCASGNRSSRACQLLKKQELDSMVNVEGGIAAWKSAGFPTVKGKGGISIMRQVQIVAGSLVLLGAVLAQWFDPRFLWLSGFVGAGLLFAGLSGTCTMALVLSKMPWNS